MRAEPPLVRVLRTGDPGLLPVVKSRLAAEGIEFMVKSEGVQDLFGGGRMGAGYSIFTGPVEIFVKEEDAERARGLIQEPVAGAVDSLSDDQS